MVVIVVKNNYNCKQDVHIMQNVLIEIQSTKMAKSPRLKTVLHLFVFSFCPQIMRSREYIEKTGNLIGGKCVTTLLEKSSCCHKCISRHQMTNCAISSSTRTYSKMLLNCFYGRFRECETRLCFTLYYRNDQTVQILQMKLKTPMRPHPLSQNNLPTSRRQLFHQCLLRQILGNQGTISHLQKSGFVRSLSSNQMARSAGSMFLMNETAFHKPPQAIAYQ